MKNTIILSILFSFVISCKGQDKNEKKKTESKVYMGNCKGEYSTKEKLTEKDKNWILNSADIERIIKLSSPITEEEWHFSYPITPCNIAVQNYLYNGKKYTLNINGGSYISVSDGKKTQLLGCDQPECKKYFLKSKENMEDENLSSSNDPQSLKNTYKVNFIKSNRNDILIVEKYSNYYILKAQTDDRIFFIKTFSCDFIEIDNQPKNEQTFNLILGFTDQYQNLLQKIVIPVFFKNNDLYVEKLFINTLATSARTGNQEWMKKEIHQKSFLSQLDIDKILSK